MHRHLVSFAFITALLIAPLSGAQRIEVPNPSFETGADSPEGWILSGGDAQWLDTGVPDGARAIAVTGTGKTETTNSWRSQPLQGLEPSSVYCITFKARCVGATRGSIISGPAFCNRDVGVLPDGWQDVRSIFLTPEAIGPDQAHLRFGQWELDGAAMFDAIAVMRAEPVYKRCGEFTLGEGEAIDGNTYRFTAPQEGESRNQSRPLHHYRANFNTQRWVLNESSEIVYLHHIGGRNQSGGRVEVVASTWGGGTLLAAASTDGSAWTPIGSIEQPGTLTGDLPSSLAPAPNVWIRLTMQPTAPQTNASCQIYGYSYSATLDGAPASHLGATRFLCVSAGDPRLRVSMEAVEDAADAAGTTFTARVENLTDAPLAARPAVTFKRADGAGGTFGSSSEMTLPKGPSVVPLPAFPTSSGEYVARFELGGGIAWTAEIPLRVPILFDAAYGALVPGATEKVALWTASSGWKVSQARPAPTATQDAVTIRAARNEAEAAQLVVRATDALKDFTAAPGPLSGPNGAQIPADKIDILRVRYVPVVRPTDETSVAAPWPDPLPPLTDPIAIAANQNQPLWIRVTPPAGIPAGVYTGAITLRAEGYQAKTPLRVEVYDFDLPDRMTCTTAFGFDPSLIFQYHRVTDPAQQRVLLDKYFTNYGAHHIAPYNPAPLDSFGVEWPGGDGWDGGLRTTQDKHAGERSLLLLDDDPHDDVRALTTTAIPIAPGVMRLRFWYKTKDAGQEILTTCQHVDANGAWMSGRNRDTAVTGDGTWQWADIPLMEFPEGAAAIHIALRPAPYAEDGATTGTAWFDDVAVVDAAGTPVFTAGFEPGAPRDLTPRFDWAAWDAAVAHARETYHFNGLCVPIQGLGGGTFYSRTEPTLGGYTEDTPEYQAMFKAYCGGLEQHLREKGWLEDSYVYWFDEPEPRDYEFVMNGFRKLKEAAPGIGRMLTEEPVPGLIDGPNIWCPVSFSYNDKGAAARQAAGERIWWYICCGPKAPYCTLFIDHAGTELRTWLWQTWQRGIQGILIWQTNYWTSDAAYPNADQPQNPYEDPMGWVSGYGYKPGERLPWGNGDGRFVYPPEAAAGANPSEPLLQGPVDSIRWEMLRDGIEDYEYFVTLKRLLAEKATPEQRARHESLLRVPDSVTSNVTTFATDPAAMETHRHALAQAIEELTR